MTRRIPLLPPSRLDEPQRAVYDAVAGGPRAQGVQHFALTDADGALRGPFNAFLLQPAVGGALQELGAAIRYRGLLSDREREIAILLVAAHADSAFERESHEAIARGIGFTDDELRALRNSGPDGFAGREASVAVVTAALLGGDLDDDAWAHAERDLGAAIVFELTTLVGYYSTLAMQLRVFRAEDYGFTP
ncbi:carboxymuconolactone decarboxylase family protein [Agromyces sp. MMS24-JH15]|uniref:carboxymuconolactone decarboxylase family protein n=1 Tax=Agromyces sp. MMS24-JH15 TaxID=3243765 RepID=UPI00374816C5